VSKIAELLRVGVEAAMESKCKRVWWQPLGRGAEMQGPSGGWMYEGEFGEDCLGTSAEMAMKHIVTMAALRAMEDMQA
jgi:hypothetical protein